MYSNHRTKVNAKTGKESRTDLTSLFLQALALMINVTPSHRRWPLKKRGETL